MACIKSAENAKDPATGRPLPDGVSCRGPRQYRTRKLVNGQQITRTFGTARLARAWLEETSVKVREGRHIDVRALDGLVLRTLIERYRDECMAHRDADRTGHIPALLREAHRRPEALSPDSSSSSRLSRPSGQGSGRCDSRQAAQSLGLHP